jgi:hypothetical protein
VSSVDVGWGVVCFIKTKKRSIQIQGTRVHR